MLYLILLHRIKIKFPSHLLNYSRVIESGMGVIRRPTRPLPVPYSIGLPYSYTTPPGTHPMSSLWLLKFVPSYLKWSLVT